MTMAITRVPAPPPIRARPLFDAIFAVPVDGQWHNLATYNTAGTAKMTAGYIRRYYRVKAVSRGCRVLVAR